MAVKSTVLIERIDGIVQRYHTTEASLLAKGYTTETVIFRDQERLAYIREEFLEEADEGPGPPLLQHYEVVFYTEYKEKKRSRHERYEIRTVVQASSREEALELASSKFLSVIPDEHSQYLDSIGLFGVNSTEAVHEISDVETYRGVKYFRNNISESFGGTREVWEE